MWVLLVKNIFVENVLPLKVVDFIRDFGTPSQVTDCIIVVSVHLSISSSTFLKMEHKKNPPHTKKETQPERKRKYSALEYWVGFIVVWTLDAAIIYFWLRFFTFFDVLLLDLLHRGVNIPMFGILIALFYVWLWRIPVTIAMQQQGGYDNWNPREQQNSLRGWGARAYAGHLNSLEAFPPFAVACLAAVQNEVDPLLTAKLILLWVIVRFFYHVSYLCNFAGARSLFFVIGFLVDAVLLYLATNSLVWSKHSVAD